MKNIRIIWIVAALLAAGTPALVAQTTTNAPTNAAAPASGQISAADLQALRTMTPEQRQEFIKTHPAMRRQAAESYFTRLGVNPADLKDLTPAQRQAKMSEAVDKKIAELEKKKAAGSITADDQKFLDQLQMRKKLMNRVPQAMPALGTNSPGPATN